MWGAEPPSPNQGFLRQTHPGWSLWFVLFFPKVLTKYLLSWEGILSICEKNNCNDWNNQWFWKSVNKDGGKNQAFILLFLNKRFLRITRWLGAFFFLCRNLPASTHRRKHRCFKLSNEVILKRCHLTQNMPPMGGHTVTHEAILPKTQPESDRSWIFLINLHTGDRGTGYRTPCSCHQQNPGGVIQQNQQPSFSDK